MNKSIKVSTIVAAILLISVGLFHASGLSWLTSEVAQSNAPEMIKEVFPILFIHVSIQCVGLACLSVLSIRFVNAHKLICYFVGVMVVVNAGLAVWLSAYPPAVVLMVIAVLYFYSGHRNIAE